MELSRFVRITRDGSDTKGGTGYLLHGDIVLTARHVVAGAQDLVVHYDDREGRAETRKVRIAWEGGDDLDVAVLAIETGLRIPRQVLDPRRFRGEVPWRSRGWARAAPETPEGNACVVDGMSPLSGRAYEFSPTARHLHVGVDDPPRSVEWWKGVSGAPVWSDRWLIGVIAQGDTPFDGKRLNAVPVAALWKEPGFLREIGHDASWQELREGRRRALADHLSEILQEHHRAAETLAAEDETWRRTLKAEGAAGLAKALVDAPSWRSVLQAIDAAHDRLLKSKTADSSGEARALEALLRRALPEVYAASEYATSPLEEGSLVVTLPVETETLAEVAMAAIEGREVDFLEVRGKHDLPQGRGMYRFESLNQRTDFDYKSEGRVREWIVSLAEHLGLQPRVIQTLGTPERFDELAKLVNFELERDVRRYSLPRRYFLFTPDFQGLHGDFLALLSEKLPALQLGVLEGRGMAEEIMDTEPLLSILFRSSEPSSHER